MFAVSPLLAVFGFLPGRAAAVCSGDIRLLLCLGLYSAVVVVVALLCLAEHHSASGYYIIDVAHLKLKN